MNADDQQYQDKKLSDISGTEIGREITYTYYIRYLNICTNKFKNGY